MYRPGKRQPQRILSILTIRVIRVPFDSYGAKKCQATHIAPLQPPTLATFRSWGSSAGAGRMRPGAANVGGYVFYEQKKFKLHFQIGVMQPFFQPVVYCFCVAQSACCI